VLIKKDAKNNLKVNSVIKCGKIFTLHYSLVDRRLGNTDQKTYDDVIQKIIRIIK
jgi:hypothetical protein